LRKLFCIVVLLGLLSSCGTVQFKHLTLYDAYEKPPAKEELSAVIYEDAVGTMWNAMFDCGEFEINNEVAHSGKSCIKLSWDKSKGCEWIGFGNSFNNWTATDMSEERLHKALTFYARTQANIAGAIPIVACMEDFSGGGSYHFIDARKYLCGLELDTTWKQVIVPLWDFPIIEDEVDIRSIKQMQFQLEGSGSFYLDDICLIDYSPEEYSRMRQEVELMKPFGAVNQIVYKEGQFAEDAWGFENNPCQELGENSVGGNTFIDWKYDALGCSWAKWGINWNGWYQSNFRGILDKSKIHFQVKGSPESSFKVILEDYNGHSVEVYRSAGNELSSVEWHDVNIPLSDLDLQGHGFVLDQIKQLLFIGEGAGEVQVDNIKISGL
jgi:hypothetical protein